MRGSARRFLLGGGAALLLVALAGCAGSGERIEFAAAPPLELVLSGTVAKPAGPGPFPAVVLFHGGCNLEREQHVSDAQHDLVRAGFLALAADSWTSRRMIGPGCPDGARGPQVSAAFADRLLDGYGAIAYLRGRPDVDASRIAVIGFSDGGRVALHLAAGVDRASAPLANAPLPRAAVGYYPSCFAPRGQGPATVARLQVPYLAHVAEREDWPGPVLCPQVFERLSRSGAPLQVFHYAGAYHDFNARHLRQMVRTPNGTVAYNSEADKLAWERTLAFLRDKLDVK